MATTPHFTHRVTTEYLSGDLRTFEVRSADQAANHSVLEIRKIGRDLVDRETGKKVRVIAVRVELL
jgi:hypothetical protein